MDLGVVPLGMTVAALMAAKSLDSLAKKPPGNPFPLNKEGEKDAEDALNDHREAADQKLADVSLAAAAAAPEAAAAPAAAAAAAAPAAPAPEAEAAAPEAAAPEAAAPEAAAARSLAMTEQKDRFWKSVQKGLSNKNERLTDSIAMGKAHPELLTGLYDVPPTPLLVEVINLATTAARANNIRSSTGDLLGFKQAKYQEDIKKTARAANAQALVNAHGGRATRRRRGGATATELETLVQMIFDQIAVECEKNPEISLQAAAAFAILVKSQPGQGDNLVAAYLLGVFNKFMAFKKMADKNPKLHIIADVMFAKMEEPFNHFFVEQKSWFVFKNALKADPKVVAELAAKADAKAAAEEAAKTARKEKARAAAEEKTKAQAAADEKAAAEAAEDITQAKRIQILAEKYDEAELDMPDKSEPGYATAENAIKGILKEYNDEIAKARGPLARAAVAKAIAESKAKVDALDKSDLESKKRAEALSKAQEEAKAKEAAAAQAAKEAEEYERIKRKVRTPTAEEVRIKAAEEEARNAAAAAAAKAAAEVRAAKAAKSAKLLAQAPHVRRPRGGKRRKLRKSTFRRHRKH